MGLILRIQGHKAILRDGAWTSADRVLEQRLNDVTRDWFLSSGGPPLNSADPEREVAREICRRLGGRILLHHAADPERAQHAYFNHRQYRFDF